MYGLSSHNMPRVLESERDQYMQESQRLDAFEFVKQWERFAITSLSSVLSMYSINFKVVT